MQPIHVLAKNPWDAQTRLDEAELECQRHAIENRKGGILVEKINQNYYVVKVSESVPFGITHEVSHCE